jgi:hypothetical protein
LPWYINTDSSSPSDGKPDSISRDTSNFPAYVLNYVQATGNSIADKQKFIAITPNRSECDVPILRFEWIREPGSTTPPLLKITLTISQRDPKSGTPQDMHLERLVELKNYVQ